jgi:hypothetical protein
MRERSHAATGAATASRQLHPRQQPPPLSTVDSLLQDGQPLDEADQAAIIAALTASHLVSQRRFRRIFGGMAFAFAAFWCYASASQVLHPWEAKYTGLLRPVTGARSVAGVLALQGAALAATGCALLLGAARQPTTQQRGRSSSAGGGGALSSAAPRVLLSCALAAAAAGACYWAAAMQRCIAKYGRRLGAHWELLWLPLGPLGYACLCCYVLASFASIDRELAQLRKLAYGHKSV